MTSTTILTFVCGIGVGLCLAFILMTLVNARRRRHFGVRAWGSTPTSRPPAPNANDEPTELDQ